MTSSGVSKSGVGGWEEKDYVHQDMQARGRAGSGPTFSDLEMRFPGLDTTRPHSCSRMASPGPMVPQTHDWGPQTTELQIIVVVVETGQVRRYAADCRSPDLKSEAKAQQ